MPITLAVASVTYSRRKRTIEYVPTFSGNYAAGGDALDFINATNPNGLPDAFPHAAVVPDSVECPSIEVYSFLAVKPNPNAIAGWLLKGFKSAGTEMDDASSYPAGVTDGDALAVIRVTFPAK